MDPVSAIALTLGVGWASGINLYAAILTLGLMDAAGAVVLPPDLQLLSSPIVIAAAALMYAVEFFADKVPGVDSGWDVLHTFIRIPAGAAMAAASVWDVDPALGLAAGLVGGTLATASHAMKAGSRLVINTSPEPFTNWGASVAEDAAVIGGMWMAVTNPWLFLVLLVLFVLLVIWLLPKLWRVLKRITAKIRSWFGGAQPPEVTTPASGRPSDPTIG